MRAERDNAKVERLLKELTEAAAIELAQDSQPVQGQAPLDSRPNLIPLICDAVEAYASVGEISGALKKSFGKFRPMVTI